MKTKILHRPVASICSAVDNNATLSSRPSQKPKKFDSNNCNNSGGSGNNSIKSCSISSSSSNNLSKNSSFLKEIPISIEDIEAEDVIFYAKLLKIDPFLEPDLLWIAKAGLVCPLPIGWIAVEDHRRRLYYHNRLSGESSWDHPNDHRYQALVADYRAKKHRESSQKRETSRGKEEKESIAIKIQNYDSELGSKRKKKTKKSEINKKTKIFTTTKPTKTTNKPLKETTTKKNKTKITLNKEIKKVETNEKIVDNKTAGDLQNLKVVITLSDRGQKSTIRSLSPITESLCRKRVSQEYLPRTKSKAFTTPIMSSSISNLQFFDDDDDVNDFADLLRIRSRPSPFSAASIPVPQSTKLANSTDISNSLVTAGGGSCKASSSNSSDSNLVAAASDVLNSTKLNTDNNSENKNKHFDDFSEEKKDSIESVEFDLENEINFGNEDEDKDDSIVSLEAFSMSNQTKKGSDSIAEKFSFTETRKETKNLQKTNLEIKEDSNKNNSKENQKTSNSKTSTMTANDNDYTQKSKNKNLIKNVTESSRLESSQNCNSFESIADNEQMNNLVQQDPFTDLFSLMTPVNDNYETIQKQRSQRPMSAKVRASSNVEKNNHHDEENKNQQQIRTTFRNNNDNTNSNEKISLSKILTIPEEEEEEEDKFEKAEEKKEKNYYIKIETADNEIEEDDDFKVVFENNDNDDDDDDIDDNDSVDRRGTQLSLITNDKSLQPATNDAPKPATEITVQNWNKISKQTAEQKEEKEQNLQPKREPLSSQIETSKKECITKSGYDLNEREPRRQFRGEVAKINDRNISDDQDDDKDDENVDLNRNGRLNAQTNSTDSAEYWRGGSFKKLSGLDGLPPSLKPIDHEAQFQQLSAQLTEQINALRSELNAASKTSERQLSQQIRANIDDLSVKYESGKNAIEEIAQKVDRLSEKFTNVESKLSTMTTTTNAMKDGNAADSMIQQKIDAAIQNLNETQLTFTRDQLKAIESRLTANQIEELRQNRAATEKNTKHIIDDSCDHLRSEFHQSFNEMRKQQNQNTSLIERFDTELDQIRADVAIKLNDSEHVPQQQRREELETQLRIVKATLRDELEHIIEKKLAADRSTELIQRQVDKEQEENLEKALRAEIQNNQQAVQGAIEEQRSQLNKRLDHLQSRIDQVMQDIDVKMNDLALSGVSLNSRKFLSTRIKTPSKTKLIKMDRQYEKTSNNKNYDEKQDLHNSTNDCVIKSPNADPIVNNDFVCNPLSQKDFSKAIKNNDEEAKLNSKKDEMAKLNQKDPPMPPLRNAVRQCRTLQKTLRYCSQQLCEAIENLHLSQQKFSDNDEFFSTQSSESSKIPPNHNFAKRERKYRSQNVNSCDRKKQTEKKQKNEIVYQDHDHEKSSLSSSSIDGDVHVRQIQRQRSNDISPNITLRLSRSTPNLVKDDYDEQDDGQHYQFDNLDYKNKPKGNHHHCHRHPIDDLESINKNYNHEWSHMKARTRRMDRKMRNIRASSSNLIALIRETGGQLREELCNLENIGTMKAVENVSPEKDAQLAPGLRRSSFGAPELVMRGFGASQTNKSNINFKTLTTNDHDYSGISRPRIVFDDVKTSNDEEQLVRQLQSIKNTINDRLKKMSIIIEQQKTTQI